MQDFLNNPYRILGLFGGAGEREIRRNKSKIEAHSRVGKTAVLDNDISLKPPNRDEKTVAEALSKIESYENRVYYSLFWFVNAKHYDEAAINYLVSGDFKKAEEIWGKVIINQKVNQQNYSGFNNYGSLKFLLSINAFEERLNLIEDGIINKLILIESPLARNFARSVAEDNYNLNTEIILKKFLKSIDNDPALQDINPVGLLSKNGVTVSETTKEILVKEPLDEIESLIDDAVKIAKNNPSNANNAARSLEKISEKNLPIIKNLLGEDDFKYDSVRNNVAKELLQCAIAYFNHYADGNDISIGKEAEYIALKAYKLATNGNIIDKASKNIEIFKSWNQTNNIRTELNELNRKLDAVSTKQTYTLDDAEETYSECKNLLSRVKYELGTNDNIYLNYSSGTVTVIQNILISVVNGVQEQLSYRVVSPDTVRETILRAHQIQQKIGGLDMHPNTRDFFLKNKRSLDSLKSQVSSTSRPGGGGCFIATVSYGSYEHPSVRKLRNFRDTILQNYKAGRVFIKIYYYISPKIAEYMREKAFLKKLTRRFIDLFINKFGKSW